MSRRKKNRVLQRMEYVLYSVVVRAIRSASDESVQRWGTRLGSLSKRLLPRRDRLAMSNLRATFPEKSERERRDILDECWRHFGRETLGYIHLQSLSPAEITARCAFVNQHILDEALAEGRGAILISAHYGGWEVAGVAVTAIAKDVLTVARPLDNEYLERDLAHTRSVTGVEVVDRKKAARPLLKALADNALVVLLPDQGVQPQEGVLVPFLGRPAWTTPVPAKLALRQASTIVFGFCIPDGLRHRLEFENPIRIGQLSAEESDPVALTERINDVISRRISTRPELWLWMHDRWKGTGESEPHGQPRP